MKRILKLLREDFNLPEQAILCFTDIRKMPQIPLWHIITQILLIPCIGIRSFLSLDIESRLKYYKKIFNTKREMVSSDSTMQRILKWLSISETCKFLLSYLDIFEKHKSLKRKLVKGGKNHRIGIIDGSFMGGHWVSVLTLSGMLNLPILIESYAKRGKELCATEQLLSKIPLSLGNSAPTLYLLDSLYFITKMFKKTVNQLNAHLVIKSKSPEFRNVLKDACIFFEKFTQGHETFSDGTRMCSYQICLTEDEFAGIPIQIIQVDEYYSKRKKDSHVHFFAVARIWK